MSEEKKRKKEKREFRKTFEKGLTDRKRHDIMNSTETEREAK